MDASKTALVLVLVAASALGWENLPSIPANRRAEYFLQHDDGAYKFGYDTGEGQSAQATADAANQVQGEYSYVDQGGQRVNWQYTAGDRGFVPVMRGDIPSGAVGAKVPGFGSRAHTSQPAAAPAPSPAASSVDADYDENADASYNFNIDTDSYKRTESSDAKGNIKGQYSYNSPIGGSHAISYIAGEGTGFVVTSDASSASQHSAGATGYNYEAPQQGYIPPAAPYAGPASNAQTQINPDGSFAFSYSTADHDHQAVADAQNNVRGSYSFVSKDDGQRRKIDYQAGAATGYVATGAHLPVAPAVPSAVSYSASSSHSSGQQGHSSTRQSGSSEVSNAQSVINPDGSFSYSYSTGDHSRQESADAQNNVRGSFSFTSKDDGKTRKVDYIAGADTGFVATGDHLPVAPSPAAAAPAFPSSAPSYSPKSSGGAGASTGYVAPSTSDAQSDGSYSFSYQTDDHSHHAASDAQGNVAGSFSFVADDGVSRKIDYTAGADQGFVAKGAHLPVAPVAPAAGGPSAPSSPADSGYNYAAPSSGSASDQSDGSNSDGSYSFSYQTDDHSHHAASDAQGNVAGSFSFVADDGVSRKIDYTAGADQGFVAKGAHLPVAPVVPAAGSPSAPSSPADSGYNYAAPSSGSASDQSDGSNSDGSYSYSYDTGSSSKQESADAQGNVAGSFSFLGGDGVNRQLTYTARADEGFIAKGDHLPVAPVAGSGQDVGLSVQNAFAHPGLFAGSANTNSGSSSGTVMASKDGAYSYSYSTGGGAGAAAAPSSPAAGQSGFGSEARKSSGSSSGHVMASKDGAYSYSYSTGGQDGAAASAGQNNVNAYSSSGAAAASSAGSQQNDGSYSFSYDAGTHSHEQSSDPNNNVRGSFSFKSKDDGQVRKVDYTAGAATGFVAKGAHLPVAPASGAAAYNGGNTGIQAAAQGGGYAAANSGASSSSDENGDGSYSYSYKTDTSSKDESADAQGNVVGTFSFIGGDGVNRKLTYTAKNEEGFIAAGDHLPVAPSVGGASQFGAKASSSQSHRFSQQATAQASAHSSSSHSSSSHSHAHALETRDGNIVISKYLPPDSVHKFGYIFDTKV